MERTTIKYIIRSLVILETKWNALHNKIASWLNFPGTLGIVHTDPRLTSEPPGDQGVVCSLPTPATAVELLQLQHCLQA